MIRSFKHKGLEQYFKFGTNKGIQSKHKMKLALILDQLNSALVPEDMNFPGSGLHRLKGKYKDLYSVRVSGNWRIVYQFEDGDAYIVDYLDYH